jgi:hypothetical protein
MTRPVTEIFLIAEQTVHEHIASILLDKLPQVETLQGGDSSLAGMDASLRGEDQHDAFVDRLIEQIERGMNDET